MSRNHVSFIRLHSSREGEVFRVCESETVSTDEEVTLAIVFIDRQKRDASVVPCGPWSGQQVIESIREIFSGWDVVERLPPPPYGGKRMLYLLVEAKSLLDGKS